MGRWWRGMVGSVLAGSVWTFAAPAAAQLTTSPGLPGQPGTSPAVEDGLLVNGSGEALYDSNVLRTSVIIPGVQRDDIRYSPEVSATYGRSTGLIALAADGLIGRDIFQYHRYLDRNRYQGGGTLTYHSGSSCQLAVNGNYSSRQAGLRDAGAYVIDPGGAPTDDTGAVIDNVLTSTIYGANAGCGSPTARLAFGGGYTHASLSNAAAARQFANSNADTYAGNIGLEVLRPGQLSLVGSYTTIAYPDRGSLIVNGVQLLGSGVKTYRIGLSFSRPLGTKLSGTVGVSYLHSDPTGGLGAYTSPAYTLGVNYAPSQRLNFVLTGSRDILPSVSAGALFRVVDQLLLSSSYTLGTSFTLNANAGLIGNQYKGAFAVGGPSIVTGGEPVRHNDTTETFGLGVTYAPRTLYDVTLNVTQAIRHSDPSIFSYSSTRVALTIAVHI